MGQVIAFPKQKKPRLAATLTTLYTIVFLLGFFIAGPSLIMFGFAFAFGAQPVAALICVGALVVDWAATKAAYTRL